jgi:aquaporin Z
MLPPWIGWLLRMRDRAERRAQAARRGHWLEYVIEALALATVMVSASFFGTLLEHPASPVRQAVPDAAARRLLMGIAMGCTAVAIVYSRWGRRSGAHVNPAITLTFLRLGRVAPADAAAYAGAQFGGALLGMGIAWLLIGSWLAHPQVHFVATRPGEPGVLAAFLAEAVLSAGLMTLVLLTAASPRLARYTGICAGTLIALYIFVEAPISGMSMNPARTFGSAFAARDFSAIWIYFAAPPLGMLAAAEIVLRRRGRQHVPCAKMCHGVGVRCIFCEYVASRAADTGLHAASTSMTERTGTILEPTSL